MYYGMAALCIVYYTVLFIIQYCICIVYRTTLCRWPNARVVRHGAAVLVDRFREMIDLED